MTQFESEWETLMSRSEVPEALQTKLGPAIFQPEQLKAHMLVQEALLKKLRIERDQKLVKARKLRDKRKKLAHKTACLIGEVHKLEQRIAYAKRGFDD